MAYPPATLGAGGWTVPRISGGVAQYAVDGNGIAVAINGPNGREMDFAYSGYASSGTSFCDFSTNGSGGVSGSSGATFELDTSQVYNGKPMMAITMGATGTLTFTWTFSTEPNLAQLKSLQIPYMFEANSTDNGSATIFAAPAIWLTKGSQQWRYTLLTSGLRSMQKHCLSIGPGTATQGWSFGGGTPPSNTSEMDAVTITSVKLVYVVTSDAVGKKFWLGEMTANQRRKGIVTLMLDGQYSSQHDYILPMIEAQGLRATMAIHAGSVGDSGVMTYAQLDRAKAAGHEFAHHTYGATIGNGYQDATQYPTEGDIYADIEAGFSNLETRGYIAAGDRFAIHGGSVHPFTNSVGRTRQLAVANAYARAGTKAIRYGSIIGGAYERAQPIGAPSNMDPYSVQGALQVSSPHSAADLQAVVTRARDRGEWAIITIHRSVISSPSTLEMTNANFSTWLATLGEEVRKSGVECRTFGDAAKRIGLTG